MKFNIILIDPPWLYNSRKNSNTKFGLGMSRYPGLSQTQLCELPINKLADDNCALFIWTVAPKLQQLFPILDCWGFRYITKAFTWVKVDKKNEPRLLPGYYTGSNTEDCYLAIKGKMTPLDKGVKQVITTTLSHHSRKPNEVRERIVKLFGDLPRIEIFATENIDGWTSIGNMIDGKDIKESINNLIK